MKRRGVYEQNRPSGRRAPRERPIHLDPRFYMELLELILRAMEWTWERAFVQAIEPRDAQKITFSMRPVPALSINRSGAEQSIGHALMSEGLTTGDY